MAPGTEITTETVELGDITYAYLAAGEPDAPLALCVHGFPDTPNGWRPLLAALAADGHRAVAPWMRGYAPTSVPDDGLSALGSWIADADAFHGRFGGDRPGVLIGHDWGALTSYGAASFAPDRWRKVVAASVPPPAVMASRLTDYDQVKAFWYQYVFLQPSAESIVAADDFRFIERLWADWSPGHDATEDLVAVKEALSGPGHLSAVLSTYRCLYDLSLQPPEVMGHAAAMLMPHPQPTLYLHGADDGCVPAAGVVEATAAVLPEGSRADLLEGAGHFLQYDEPERVVQAVRDFLT